MMHNRSSSGIVGSSPIGRGVCRASRRPLKRMKSRMMLQWLPTLQAVFPEAVELAVRMPVSQLNFPMLIFDIDRKNYGRSTQKTWPDC